MMVARPRISGNQDYTISGNQDYRNIECKPYVMTILELEF